MLVRWQRRLQNRLARNTTKQSNSKPKHMKITDKKTIETFQWIICSEESYVSANKQTTFTNLPKQANTWQRHDCTYFSRLHTICKWQRMSMKQFNCLLNQSFRCSFFIEIHNKKKLFRWEMSYWDTWLQPVNGLELSKYNVGLCLWYAQKKRFTGVEKSTRRFDFQICVIARRRAFLLLFFHIFVS